MIDFNAELAKWGLNETTYEACLKDIDDKIAGNIDCDWIELIEKYNLNMASDSMRKASSSVPFGRVFVEKYKAYKKATTGASDTYLEELKNKQQELRKEKQKVQDERMELQRLLREQARRESFIDLIKRVFEKSVEPLDYIPSPVIESDNDLIVCLSDLHCGLEVDNFFNTFNSEVLRERLRRYIDKIIAIQKRHNGKICYLVLLGDNLSGLIHVNLRLQNNEDVVSQVKLVSELIGEFTLELSKHFERVEIHSVSGNHSRLSPKKEDNLKKEYLDALIPFYLNLLFKGSESVKVRDNVIDDTILSFKTRGDFLYYGVHGHLDPPSTVVKNLTLMTGTKPNGVLLGHRHHNAYTSEHGVKVVCAGSALGTDDYCVDHRISGRAEQCVIVTSDIEAVECFYDINLQ